MAVKIKNEYDENGHWVQERNRIKGAIRRAFRLSPQMKEVLKAARVELPPLLKKDGTPGKRPQVRYRCAICQELFSQKNVQVDHLDPVVPLHMPEKLMSYDGLVRGVFCAIDRLQVVCSTPLKRNNGLPSCHKIKTDEENFIRRSLIAFLKGEGLEGRTDVDFTQFIEPHRALYKEYLIEKELKLKQKEERKNERERRKAKK
jgi:hypothetical protein